MGIPLLVIAVILFAAAYQNQLGYLAKNAEEDLKGSLKWIAAMAAIGAIGLIPKMKVVSNALFFLVILVLLIANKGIFANIASGKAFTPVSPPKAPPQTGGKAQQATAGPGVKASGTLDPGAGAGAAGTGSVGLGGAGGILGNVIPFPNLKFGDFDFGKIVGGATAGSSDTSKAPDSSGVTIESIDFGV